MQEEWRTIEKYPNYMISNLGNIKSLNYKRTGKEQTLKQNINGRGYCYVNISSNGKYNNLLIHREVAKAFLKNDDKNKTDINHKDGNKLNNNINNLEWCTRSENILHAYRTGLKTGGKGLTYKKRCQLAIEYIEKYSSISGYYFNSKYNRENDCLDVKERLLNILQGKSDE
jgi:hypothetical protein